jgi:hypothetical protein
LHHGVDERSGPSVPEAEPTQGGERLLGPLGVGSALRF